MSLLHKAVEDVTLEDLERLVANEVYESRHLDYKQELPDVGATGDEKREFLYDLAAMANAGGGDIVFGIEEDRTSGRPTGRPARVTGVPIPALDARRLWLENLIRDGIKPRVIGIRIHAIRVAGDSYAVVLRLPRSLNAPHMVDTGGTQRFYSRNSGGKYPMDVGEIRAAFLATAGFMERAEAWRDGRIARLLANEGATLTLAGEKLVLHLTPLAFTDRQTVLDARSLQAQSSYLGPLRCVALRSRFNIDGYMTYSTRPGDSLPHGYVQFFRTGQIEAVDVAGLLRLHTREEYRRFHSIEYERAVIDSTHGYLAAMRAVGIQPPIVISLSLLDVEGYSMGLPAAHPLAKAVLPVESRHLVLPSVVLEDWPAGSGSIATLLRPTFDSVWNACGLPASLNYDEAGVWRPYAPS